MPQPTHSDLHVNTLLSNIAVAYYQRAENFIAERIFPSVPVQFQSDYYASYDKGYWFRTEAAVRPPTTETPGTGWKVSTDNSYKCKVYGVHHLIDREQQANQQAPFNVERDAARLVADQLLLLRDIQWSDTYFKLGVWGTDITGVSGTPSTGQFKQWDVSGSTPIDDILGQQIAIAEQTGYRPNVLILTPYVLNALRNHADIIDRIKYTQRGVVSADLLAQLFEVDEVVVAWGIKNTALETDPASMHFIHGKNALLVYRAPSPSLFVPSGGYTFTWTGLLGAGAGGPRIKRLTDDHKNSIKIEGEMAYDMKVIATDVGVFFSGAVA